MSPFWTKLAVAIPACAASASAFGTLSQPISEPGILELLAVGAIAGVIIWARNRRK